MKMRVLLGLLAMWWICAGCNGGGSDNNSSDDPAESANEEASITVVESDATTSTEQATTSTEDVSPTSTEAEEPVPTSEIDVTGTWSVVSFGTSIDVWKLSQSGVSVQGTNMNGRRVVGSVSGDRFLADLLPADGKPNVSVNGKVSGNSMSGTATTLGVSANFTATR